MRRSGQAEPPQRVRDAATSGLDYYGARYYNPLAGQFTSADTTLAGGLNRYAYVGGNPETKTDPTGHCPWCIAGAIIGAVVGAGIVYGVQVYNNYQTGAKNPWGDNIDWGAVGMGALAGAFVGATMGAGATAVAGVFAAGGSVGTAVSAGAGAAAMFAGYGIAPTIAGAEATDVEIDAEIGLADNRAARTTSSSSTSPTTASAASSDINLPTSETWGRPDSLSDHFARHGSDFGAASSDDYANQASKFLQSSQKQGLETLVTNDGSLMVYDPATNTIGAYNGDGTTQTFFKPPDGEQYWANQHGRWGTHAVQLLQ